MPPVMAASIVSPMIPTDHGRKGSHPGKALPKYGRRLRGARTFGTLQNEGASKGILITTSGYGQASFNFDEQAHWLLDGANLLHLLREHAGIEARIAPPDDWRDPVPDIAVDEDVASAPSDAVSHARTLRATSRTKR